MGAGSRRAWAVGPWAAGAWAAGIGGALLVGCASSPVHSPIPGPPPPAVSTPAQLCNDPSLEDDDFCLPIERIESLLTAPGEAEVLHVSVSYGGVSLPNVVHVAITDPVTSERLVLKLKWKKAPWMGGGLNNEPRKELAAYVIQRLFLEPEEYVVPPTVGRCVRMERYNELVGPAKATFPDVDCVYVVLSYWLQNVTPDGARDLKRARSDPAFRDNLAAMNLLTYLVDHRDSRDANFLRSKDPDRPRVFAIDNGLAFGGLQNPFQKLVGDWGDLHVPSLSRRHVEKLRGLTHEQLATLAVVEQYENRGGQLVAVPPTAPLEPEKGVSWNGEILQFGLTSEEIEAVEERLKELLEEVDEGEIALH